MSEAAPGDQSARPIVPVLLCGGSGTRLWPLSRQSYPKQFSQLTGEESLFQASVRRLGGPGFAAPVVLTASDFRFIVAEQMLAVGRDPAAILLEPEGRNTAPAALAAALWVAREDPAALLLLAPSDHVIRDTEGFRAAIDRARPAAEAGRIVTFGIAPTHAETGYGYLELAEGDGTEDGEEDGIVPLKGFVEKPDAQTAAALVAGGRHLWNAGIFLFAARTLIDACAAHAPDLHPPVAAALERGKPDLGFFRLDPEAWRGTRAVSIDYAVMERAGNLAVVPFAGGWSDLGDWKAVWAQSARDGDGVALSGSASAIDCRNTLLRSEADTLQVVGIGLRDIIAVAMPDSVLIADAGRAQDVRLAVEALKAQGAAQAIAFPKDHRPWGWFESLVTGPRFQVKRILVHPGAALSLQSHHHRSEHWIVVEGTAKVTVDGEVKLVTENQSVYIPLGARHRMENPGKLPMVLIEVQTGAYLGEDDILRYEDVYART
ncbi:mannose-1-phosphate guanylyltransferase/mannose-6-phosphate isomerase [Oceaniglobus roseus]|uniref:mannose-1-phosphate guanylyltransferase/mannose-6-phosphate isomerase n=1 Tax=Oceaniglobus roseus TaxID=1737570 RepID=UPI000C7E8E34|nr:mannose-1-phosphate guanylyltransferase/mannose-6-phosphate isomerase [Kandeliimicrobium roseum]